jgi:Tol biopolymer transport system component
VLSRTDHDPGGDLWVIEVDTGRVERSATGDFSWPEWSPDGSTIAAVTQRDGGPFVVLLDGRGGQPTDFTPGDLPRWSADGGSLFVTRAGTIVRVDTLDSSEVVLGNGCCASIGVDGHRIAFGVES